MLQKEVAQRICAKPPEMSLLAVSVQIYGAPSIASYAKKGCFWPQPKVDSAILKIVPHKEVQSTIAVVNNGDRISMQQFFQIVKAGFKQPRKQLLNNLLHGLSLNMLEARRLTNGGQREFVKQWLRHNNIQPTQRAETLSIQDWKHLAESFLQT